MKEILVNKDGYKQFYDEIERLKKLSTSNAKLGSEVYQDAVGDGWHDNFAFEESMRESRSIAKKIDDMLALQQYLKIIDDNDKKSNLVNIGDSVEIEMKYAPNDIENEIITLTGKYIPDHTTNEISLNSPLGKALFKAKIGASTSYRVGDSEISIKILTKINDSKD